MGAGPVAIYGAFEKRADPGVRAQRTDQRSFQVC
jgi:hypothetical protein